MNEKRIDRKFYTDPFIQQLLMKYVLTLILFSGLLVLTAYASYRYLSARIWYETNPAWGILHWLHQNIILIGCCVILFGWLVITFLFAGKMLQAFSQVVRASGQIVERMNEPVQLSAGLKTVEDELNQIRQEAVRNAYMAKEAEQRKNDLIVYLAHDLKTPLTSVIGYLTLLKEEPDISKQMREKFTQIAWEKAQRLENLINEFFEIARFNLTTMTLEKEWISLSMLLEQLISEFAPILSEKGLYCETEITPDIRLLCDADKLERVFDNLMRNAVNYSYPDTPIAVKMQPKDGEVIVCISNHGKTIAPEKLSHIFEQFYRLDSSRATATGGAGLGLAIAKEIVELHGGTIFAESRNEQILFTVRLPMER